MERPHSRKVKKEEGIAEVRKGEKVEGTVRAGSGEAPLRGALQEKEDKDKD